jgi:DNA-binding NarL/FixJ family response regulator
VSPRESAVRRDEQAQTSTAPSGGPRLVFARDDAAGGADKGAETSERILLVEDDFLVAMQMESALAEAGFEIAGIASSGEDAIELALSERPRLAVMDVRLAGRRDGIDTALQLFAEHGIRCIFATAHHDEHARRRAAPAAPLGWLHKPYTMASLVDLVRSALAELDETGP